MDNKNITRNEDDISINPVVVLAYLVCPVFMAWKDGIENTDGGTQDAVFFLAIPAIIMQIAYWYLICGIPGVVLEIIHSIF